MAGKEGTVWDGMERVSLDHEMIEYLFEYRGKDASAAARDSKQMSVSANREDGIHCY